MTGSKHNHEGNSGEGSEPGPGPYCVTGASGSVRFLWPERSRFTS
jgi:hypothetical protein